MRKNFSSFVLVFSALCMTGHALYAQSFKYQADVPFSFHTAKNNLPAGKYMVDRPFSSSVAWMQSVSDGTRIAVTAAPASLEQNGHARLVFHRVGSDYYLAEIWSDAGKGTVVPRGRAEKAAEERTALNRPEVVTIYLASAR